MSAGGWPAALTPSHHGLGLCSLHVPTVSLPLLLFTALLYTGPAGTVLLLCLTLPDLPPNWNRIFQKCRSEHFTALLKILKSLLSSQAKFIPVWPDAPSLQPYSCHWCKPALLSSSITDLSFQSMSQFPNLCLCCVLCSECLSLASLTAVYCLTPLRHHLQKKLF